MLQPQALFICETCDEPLYDCPRGGYHGPWAYNDAPGDVQRNAEEAFIRRFTDSVDNRWSDCIEEDAERVADILGITINRDRYNEPEIYYDIYGQGSGACFAGRYAYRKGALKEIKGYASQDNELHRIAKGLQDLQRRAFYQLTADITKTGNYNHENSTSIEVYRIHPRTQEDLDPEPFEKGLADLLRDFMRWIHKQLEKEWEYQTSKEHAREDLEDMDPQIDEEGDLC